MQQFVRAKSAATEAARQRNASILREKKDVSRNEGNAPTGRANIETRAVRSVSSTSETYAAKQKVSSAVDALPQIDPFDTDYEESTVTLSDYGSVPHQENHSADVPLALPVRSNPGTAELEKPDVPATLSIFHDESYPSTTSSSVHEADLRSEASFSNGHQVASDQDGPQQATPTRSRRPLYAPHDYRQRHIRTLVRDYQTRLDAHPSEHPQQAESVFPVSELSEAEHESHDVAEPSFELDYDLKDLMKMSYEQLADESFDCDPSRSSQDQSDAALSLPLADRLHKALSQDSTHQEALLASLSIDEWDQAGQWFDEQFQHNMGRMRQARRDKRAAAAAFEAEIAHRHEAVILERDQLAAALDKMRANGGLVLRDSTPRKASS